jgi:hypothetical protein
MKSPKIKRTSPTVEEGKMQGRINMVLFALVTFLLLFSISIGSQLFSQESRLLRLESYYDGHGTGKVVDPDPAPALGMQVKRHVQESAELLSSTMFHGQVHEARLKEELAMDTGGTLETAHPLTFVEEQDDTHVDDEVVNTHQKTAELVSQRRSGLTSPLVNTIDKHKAMKVIMKHATLATGAVQDNDANKAEGRGLRGSDASVVWLTMLTRNGAHMTANMFDFMMELNCQYAVPVHLVTGGSDNKAHLLQARQDYLIKKKRVYNSEADPHPHVECSSFVVADEPNNLQDHFPNRVERISFLRDFQRIAVQKEMQANGKSTEAKVVIVVDGDLHSMPSPAQVAQLAEDIMNGKETNDVICAAGVNHDNFSYHDTFATILEPNDWMHHNRIRYPNEKHNKIGIAQADDGDLPTFADQNKLRNLLSHGYPVPVRSCFGGLALYKANIWFQKDCSYHEAHYDDWRFANREDERPCEHVVLHECLRRSRDLEQNKDGHAFSIAIDPTLITEYHDIERIKPGLPADVNRLKEKPRPITYVEDQDGSRVDVKVVNTRQQARVSQRRPDTTLTAGMNPITAREKRHALEKSIRRERHSKPLPIVPSRRRLQTNTPATEIEIISHHDDDDDHSMVSAFTRSTMGEESFYGRESQSFHNEAEEDDEGVAPPPPNESLFVPNTTNRSLVGYNNETETETQPVMDDNDMTITNSTNENNMNNNTSATMIPCIDMFGDVNGGSPWFDSDGYNCALYANYDACAVFGNNYANCGTDEDEDGTLDWTLGDGSCPTANTVCCACGGGSSSIISADDIDSMARQIWRDALMLTPYPWSEDAPCVESPTLKNPDNPAATFAALARVVTAVLRDERLNPTVERVMLFNMDMHSPMMAHRCTPLVDTVDLLLIERALDRAVVAYKKADVARTKQVCLDHPILSPINEQSGFRYDSSVHQKLSVMTSIWGTDFLADPDSDRYKAACWILYDDPHPRSATHPLFVQRYAMAVFYYGAKANENEVIQERFENEFTEDWFYYVSFNSDGFLTTLYAGKRRYVS